jgi:hypothetical protein
MEKKYATIALYGIHMDVEYVGLCIHTEDGTVLKSKQWATPNHIFERALKEAYEYAKSEGVEEFYRIREILPVLKCSKCYNTIFGIHRPDLNKNVEEVHIHHQEEEF